MVELIKVCANLNDYIEWNFKFEDFYKILSSYCFPSLEFLWNLHILQIQPLEAYIMYAKKDILKKFKESVISLCILDLGENDAQYLIQTGIFLMEEKQTETKRLHCFFSLWNAGILEEVTLQNFCSFAIDHYLNFCPATNDLAAFEILDSTDYSSAPYHVLPVLERTDPVKLSLHTSRQNPTYAQLVKSLNFAAISHIFATIAQKIQTDIKCLLVTARAFRKTEGASNFIRKFTLELMNEAYKTLNYNLLLRALLIGRQAAFEPNIRLHVCHKNWLQSVFNDSCYLKDKQCFLLLLQVLTDLVPFHRSVECLKIAIELSVHIPSEAQSGYSDYIVLLKTRIQDLKPQTKPGETIEKVLSLFEVLGKIPPVVLEASLLQKHKFLNEFLPALLTPRVVPQIPDLRERFIEALDKAAKIPSNMLQKYKEDCQLEQEKLLRINMINENFDDFI